MNKNEQAAVLAGTAAQNQMSDQVTDYQKLSLSTTGKYEAQRKNTSDDTNIQNLRKAFDETIPVNEKDIGKIGNEPIFRLCRKLAGLLNVNIPAEKLLDNYKHLFVDWFRKSSKIFETTGNAIESYEDFLIQFTYIWDNKKVKHPDIEYIPMALSNARKWYQSPRPEMAWCKDQKILLLAAVCYELQTLCGGDYFWVSQYDAEKVCGKQARQCGFILTEFCKRGILKKIKSGDRFRGGNANEYQYIGGQGQIDALTVNRMRPVILGSNTPPTDIPEIADATDFTGSLQGYTNTPHDIPYPPP